MKVLQQNADYDGIIETHLWDGKSARDVLREAYHDRCTIRKVDQPKSTRTDITRPTTYVVYDRSEAEGRENDGDPVGILVELD